MWQREAVTQAAVLVEPRGSATFLSLVPENGQKTASEMDGFTETGPGSGTILTLM
jgi:hypothetical protein